jgi:hypothetical protein
LSSFFLRTCPHYVIVLFICLSRCLC